MSLPEDLTLTRHHEPPRDDAAVVDAGLDRSNEQAAPIDVARPLACFARAADGRVIGGAVGEQWDDAAELGQLWVDPEWRGRGVGRRLVAEYEDLARSAGCRKVVLETFTFQAPDWYRKLGYEVAHEITVYPHGVVKYVMTKLLADAPA